MSITYNDTKKDLPCEQIQHLFVSAGWSDGSYTEYMNIPFINSTIVISAWENERLVGVIRALSDKFGRSVIYDLVVDPDYQGKGIGTELVNRCIAHFPKSEWLLGCKKDRASFYERIGFKIDTNNEVFMSIPSHYQGNPPLRKCRPASEYV